MANLDPHEPHDARDGLRLELLGRLAGGVAHDFNNLLTVVFGSVDALRRTIGPNEHLEDIALVAERARELVRQVLVAGSGEASPNEVVDLGEVVAGMARILRWLVPHGVELQVSTVAGGDVEMSEIHIHQLLMNLVVNAGQAIEDEGRVAVRAGVVVGEQWVELLVRDDGRGMDEATQQRLFEPFFTRGKVAGTGLGLSTVHDIARAAGARLSVESSPGCGTTVTIWLPCAASRPAASARDG